MSPKGLWKCLELMYWERDMAGGGRMWAVMIKSCSSFSKRYSRAHVQCRSVESTFSSLLNLCRQISSPDAGLFHHPSLNPLLIMKKDGMSSCPLCPKEVLNHVFRNMTIVYSVCNDIWHNSATKLFGAHLDIWAVIFCFSVTSIISGNAILCLEWSIIERDLILYPLDKLY